MLFRICVALPNGFIAIAWVDLAYEVYGFTFFFRLLPLLPLV